MELIALVLLLVTVTYAINILKIRMVVSARPVAAVGLEAAQSFMYVYVLVQVMGTTNTTAGIIAYVAGASLGTLVAMLLQKRDAAVPAHSHTCCSGRDATLPLPSESAERTATRVARRPAP